MRPFIQLVGIVLSIGTLTVQANNQFDDLVYPPTQNQTPMTPPPVYGANPNLPFAPNPYGYGVPYNMSSYPYGYNPYPYGRALIPPPQVPQPQAQKKERKAWGDVRHIWPDFYTDMTNDMWDKMINAPYDMGYMPGGWRFPSLSTPDPVTVGDAVANQVPPIMEEIPNFMNFAN